MVIKLDNCQAIENGGDGFSFGPTTVEAKGLVSARNGGDGVAFDQTDFKVDGITSVENAGQNLRIKTPNLSSSLGRKYFSGWRPEDAE